MAGAQTFPRYQSADDKHCDLCSGAHFELIAARDRRGQPLDTVVCRECGLVSHGRIPTAQEVDDYYAEIYRQDYHGEYQPSARRVVRAWRVGQYIQRRLAPCLTGDEAVLEIGAGIGGNVKAFELQGFRSAGIEPGRAFQQFGVEHLRADLECGNLFDLPPTPRCDLVLLIHVIEHFRSPREALAQIHRILRPGGKLYVECPNLAAPFARRSKMFHFAHIYNFTPRTLSMLARRCGFRVDERQLANPHDANLRVLLHRQDSTEFTVDSQSYADTLGGYLRYNDWTYYLRPQYARERVHELRERARERLTAERELTQILDQCRETQRADRDGQRAA